MYEMYPGMSKPMPPGEYLPAWSVSGSRPAGFFSRAMRESIDSPAACTLLPEPTSLAAVRSCASPLACWHPVLVKGWATPFTDQEPGRVVGELAHCAIGLVGCKVGHGERACRGRPEFLGIGLAEDVSAGLDHSIAVDHENHERRRGRRALRFCSPGQEDVEHG